MQNIQKTLYIIVFLITQGFSYSVAMTLGEAITQAANIGSTVTLMTNVYSVGKDVKSYVYPNDAEQVQAMQTEKQLQLIEVRRDLRNCLINNRKETKKNALGIPVACDEIAFVFGILGARAEVARMVAIFNTYNK